VIGVRRGVSDQKEGSIVSLSAGTGPSKNQFPSDFRNIERGGVVVEVALKLLFGTLSHLVRKRGGATQAGGKNLNEKLV